MSEDSSPEDESVAESEVPTPENSLRAVPRDEDFVSTYASRFATGYTDDQMFFLDFRRPDFHGVGSPGGDVSIQANLMSMAQIYLPPKSAKELLEVLEEQVSEYEERYGEIETDDDELEKVSGEAHAIPEDNDE